MTDFNSIAAALRLPHQKLGEVIFMQENPEVVHFQLDQSIQPQPTQTKKVPEANKALLIKVNTSKTVLVYNHVQSYILDALLKPVFWDAHWPEPYYTDLFSLR